MSQKVYVDPAQCVGCGRCLDICPMRIFQPGGQGSVPAIGPNAEKCIACGHCVAACPGGAITASGSGAASLQKADLSLLPTYDQFAALVAQRRSIRKFKSQPIPQEKIDRLIDLLRMAPTAKNLLPLQWTVVNNPQSTHRLAGIIVDGIRSRDDAKPIIDAWEQGYDWVLRGAPCLIFAHTDETSNWTAFDSSIAVEIADLAAPLLGLGACWAGYFISAAGVNPILRSALSLGAADRIGAALMLGIPDDETYLRVPYRPEPAVRYLEP
ncbi:MAG: nitroreductase family protein [Thermoguttaceae bacterium]|nr:nitroreductase family protein [Thermoguttaceae bacterium]MBQ6619415.1 nitroreductase family protein [Thermoguttaceae bacterium]